MPLSGTVSWCALRLTTMTDKASPQGNVSLTWSQQSPLPHACSAAQNMAATGLNPSSPGTAQSLKFGNHEQSPEPLGAQAGQQGLRCRSRT